MLKHSSAKINQKQFGGAALVLAGTSALVAYGSISMHYWGMALDTPGAEAVGQCAALGLTLLRIVRVLAFDHSLLLSMASPILVLFPSLAVFGAGLMLLAKRTTGRLAYDGLTTPGSAKGDQ
jgi:hypothetical protein